MNRERITEDVEMEFQSGEVTGTTRASVRIYVANKLVKHVIADVVHKSGGDGRRYPCVDFITVTGKR